jgi:hypothetical protein
MIGVLGEQQVCQTLPALAVPGSLGWVLIEPSADRWAEASVHLVHQCGNSTRWTSTTEWEKCNLIWRKWRPFDLNQLSHDLRNNMGQVHVELCQRCSTIKCCFSSSSPSLVRALSWGVWGWFLLRPSLYQCWAGITLGAGVQASSHIENWRCAPAEKSVINTI